MIDLSPKKKEHRLKTSVSLPDVLRCEARRVAGEHGISLSEYLRRVVEADLSQRRRGSPL